MAENYKVMEKIGKGMFGSVYKARRRLTAQIVALKLIPKSGKNGKEKAGLRREIEILKGLKHDNIILLLDDFETDEHFCVVTEYARGELFEVLQREKRLPESLVQNIAFQLVMALQYLHQRRVIHRDMKPQNVLISAKGTVKLCDFGFARSNIDRRNLIKSIKGTPLYMAPELVCNKAYDHRVDLWSLGVIVYELYYGAPPFVADGFPQLFEVIQSHTVVYDETISASFRGFLRGLLVKDPAQRLQWPDLASHDFVRDAPRRTDADLSRLHQLAWTTKIASPGGEEDGTVAQLHRVDGEDMPEGSLAPQRALVSPVLPGRHKRQPRSPIEAALSLPSDSSHRGSPNQEEQSDATTGPVDVSADHDAGDLGASVPSPRVSANDSLSSSPNNHVAKDEYIGNGAHSKAAVVLENTGAFQSSLALDAVTWSDEFNFSLLSQFNASSTQLHWPSIVVTTGSRVPSSNPLELFSDATEKSQLECSKREFWTNLQREAKTAMTPRSVFRVVGICSASLYTMISNNWRLFARGQADVSPDTLSHNINAASILIAHARRNVRRFFESSIAPGTSGSQAKLMKGIFVALRSMGLVSLLCVFFFATNHVRRKQFSSDAEDSSSNTDIVLVPCFDALHKLLQQVIAAAGVFLIPDAAGRAPSCWMMPYITQFASIIEVYHYYRPLRAKFDGSVHKTPSRHVRGHGTTPAFELLRAMFATMKLFSFTSTGIYVKLHSAETMDFVVKCIRRSTKALKHCVAAAMSASELAKTSGSMEDSNAASSLCSARTSLLAEARSQLLAICDFLHPAIRKWDELHQHRVYVGALVDQELQMQKLMCLPIENVKGLTTTEDIALPVTLTGEVIKKKIHIHGKSFNGLREQIFHGLLLTSESGRVTTHDNMHESVRERPTILVVCRALAAIIEFVEPQFACDHRTPLTQRGLVELSEAIGTLEVGFNLLRHSAGSNDSCCGVLLADATVLSIVQQLNTSSPFWKAVQTIQATKQFLAQRLGVDVEHTVATKHHGSNSNDGKAAGVVSAGKPGVNPSTNLRTSMMLKRVIMTLGKIETAMLHLLRCLLEKGVELVANGTDDLESSPVSVVLRSCVRTVVPPFHRWKSNCQNTQELFVLAASASLINECLRHGEFMASLRSEMSEDAIHDVEQLVSSHQAIRTICDALRQCCTTSLQRGGNKSAPAGSIFANFGISQSNPCLESILSSLEAFLSVVGDSGLVGSAEKSRNDVLSQVWTALLSVVVSDANGDLDSPGSWQWPFFLGPFPLLCFIRLLSSLIGQFGHLPMKPEAAPNSALSEPTVFLVLRNIADLLGSEHIASLLGSNAWRLGGGFDGVALLLRYIASVIGESFGTQCNDAQFGQMQKILFDSNIVAKMIAVMQRLCECDGAYEAGRFVEDLGAVVYVLSRLTVASTRHSKQFLMSNGPAVTLNLGFLGRHDQESSIFDVLAMFIHLAKESAHNVAVIVRRHHRANGDGLAGSHIPLFSILSELLLHHPSIKVHELVCKLVGNLFRHSGQCYSLALDCGETPTILDALSRQLQVRAESLCA
mgnify:FL=1